MASGAGGYFLGLSQRTEDIELQKEADSTLLQQTISPNDEARRGQPDNQDWLTYTNTAFGYTVMYPHDWKIINLAAGSGGAPSPESVMIDIQSPDLLLGNATLQLVEKIPSPAPYQTATQEGVNGKTYPVYTENGNGMLSKTYYVQLQSNKYLEVLVRPITSENEEIFLTLLRSLQVGAIRRNAGELRILDTEEYSAQYPSDFDIRHQQGYSTLVKLGPTQRDGTEMYDGVLINFIWHTLGGQTLESFVDTKISQVSDGPVGELMSGKTSAKLGEYDGFSYQVQGMGTYTEYFITKGNADSALQIEVLVEDPTSQGFQQRVNQILSTVKIKG